VIKNAVYYVKSKLPEDPKLQKHIAIMEKEIANSNKIISDLLGFSRIRPPAINPQGINKVVEDTLEVVEIPKNVKLVKKLEADLPNAMADPDQIRQVFVNLSLNAIQAMSEGGQLNIATRRNDGFIEVEFTDTGCGIVEENLEKLFDPFFTTRARGIGLGLAVTQGIIERHNGNIEVKSEVEKGTTFVVKLPVEKKEI
jgi:two-component system NtrC family sensor kinase